MNRLIPIAPGALRACLVFALAGAAQAAALSVNLATTPANSPVAPGATVTLSASANDSKGTISRVEFYDDGNLIGQASKAPYTFAWKPADVGRHRLVAEAYDTRHHARSQAVHVIVDTPPTVKLVPPTERLVAPAQVKLMADTSGASPIRHVAYYSGTTLIGERHHTPFALDWRDVGVGSYTITAVATDEFGLSTTSDPLTITVLADQPPTVQLSAPKAGQVYAPGSDITLTANVSDFDGSASRHVSFYEGSTLLATVHHAPYTHVWHHPAIGRYMLTVQSTDDHGLTTTSAPVTIAVGTPPQVSVANATQGKLIAPQKIALSATAASGDSTISKVEFYNGTTLIGTATASPYTVMWNDVAAGSYNVTAIATDALGITNNTTALPITVIPDTPPQATLAGIKDGQVLAPGANVTLTAANLQTLDGNNPTVVFRAGNTTLATLTAPPYSYAWNTIPVGKYPVTLTVTDDKGLSTTTPTATITVDTAPTVAITAPTPKQIATPGGSFTLKANATATDGQPLAVSFYDGTTLIGTSQAAPYTFVWNNLPVGSHTITAFATDDLGLSSTSMPVAMIVDASPTLAITSPTPNQMIAPGSDLLLTATSIAADGHNPSIAFFHDGTLIGTVDAPPYSITWKSVPLGSYSLTVQAIDDLGLIATSPPITVTADVAPTLTLAPPTAPNGSSTLVAGQAITLTANPQQGTGGGSIAQVTFYDGGTQLGIATAAPYSYTWTNATAGAHGVIAKVMDSVGTVVSSQSMPLMVLADQKPVVAIISPTQNAKVAPGSTVTLTATVSTTDGNLPTLVFYNGATLIGNATGTANPIQAGQPQTWTFSYAWQNVPAGNYAITAQATDDLGLSNTTQALALAVQGMTTTVYDIYTDPMNTPRLVTDSQNNVVWSKPGIEEPFGIQPPQTIAGSSFVLNLRADGYLDQEAGLIYSLNRYRDPATGAWLTGDPIGLAGGQYSLLSYLNGNPVNHVDPSGLYDSRDFAEDMLGVSNFAAGLGNAATFGFTSFAAKQFMNSKDAAALDKVKRCSTAYKAGEWASLALGAGRLLYAGVAKVGAAAAADGLGAMAFRNGLKRVMRGPLATSSYRIKAYEDLLAQYGSDEAIQAAAGRTNPGINTLGADLAAGGAKELASDSDCGCP